MRLTFWNRLKLCFEVLTIRSGHAHQVQEKQLSTFQRGYCAGMEDGDWQPLPVVSHTLPDRCKNLRF